MGCMKAVSLSVCVYMGFHQKGRLRVQAEVAIIIFRDLFSLFVMRRGPMLSTLIPSLALDSR